MYLLYWVWLQAGRFSPHRMCWEADAGSISRYTVTYFDSWDTCVFTVFFYYTPGGPDEVNICRNCRGMEVSASQVL
jgi:hypothetical protein